MDKTATVEDWFLNCFIPAVKEYRREKTVPVKIILVLDNALGHPQHTGKMYPDVKVVFLLPIMIGLILLMDQGTITVFKAYY